MISSAETLLVGSAPCEGERDFYARLVRAAARVIAADGGLEVCLAAGRVPEVCVGDFDSVSPSSLTQAIESGTEVRRYPTAKNESDLDLALLVARELGTREVVMTGAFHARLDHTLSSLGTLVSAADLCARAEEPDWTGWAVDAAAHPELTLDVPEGSIISVMGIGGPLRVTLEGFVYPLHEFELDPLSSRGLSNVTLAGPQRVRASRGRGVVIINR